jgi:hypothetical protein
MSKKHFDGFVQKTAEQFDSDPVMQREMNTSGLIIDPVEVDHLTGGLSANRASGIMVSSNYQTATEI